MTVHSFSAFKKRQYRPSILLRYQAEANTGRAFFYAIKQRQILDALSFTLSSRGKYCYTLSFSLSSRGKYCFALSFTPSSRGKYWPRILFCCQAEAFTFTVCAFFYAIKQKQILAAHSSFLHPLNLVGELLLDVDLGISLL